MYGGTNLTTTKSCRSSGLSPRVRGNRRASMNTPVVWGSIPACTGEPVIGKVVSVAFQVYPRVYGGTALLSGTTWKASGLSPRVRGNRVSGPIARLHRRSIPACTGEPCDFYHYVSHNRVYPRVYGGTPFSRLFFERDMGLSPRVRGNHQAETRPLIDDGSIPACTGEPGQQTACQC